MEGRIMCQVLEDFAEKMVAKEKVFCHWLIARGM